MPDMPMDEQPDQQAGDPPQSNRDAAFDAIVDAAPAGVPQQTTEQIATIFNDYQQRQQILQTNENLADQYVNDLSQWKSGMEAAVRNDPTFVHHAMAATAAYVSGMVNSVDAHSDDLKAEHGQAIIDDFHKDLATLSVYHAAERNELMARDLLNDPTVQTAIGDEDRIGALGKYIGHQADARARDAATQQDLAAQQQVQRVQDRTMNYLGALVGGQFPPTWNSSLLADTVVPNGTKGLLGDLYGKLRTEGEPQSSDAATILSITKQLAAGGKVDPEQMIGLSANGVLRPMDAVHLYGLRSSKDQMVLAAQNLQAAQDYLMGPDGENGAAGARAFGRFSNWFMDQWRNNPPEVLDPRSEAWIMNNSTVGGVGVLDHFLPRGDDLLEGPIPPGVGYTWVQNDRGIAPPSLKDIFSGQFRQQGNGIVLENSITHAPGPSRQFFNEERPQDNPLRESSLDDTYRPNKGQYRLEPQEDRNKSEALS